MYKQKIKYKILICDDNEFYIKRLTPELSKINYDSNFEVITDSYSTPSEIINAIRTIYYDVIILDVCIRDNYSSKANDSIISSLYKERYGQELYEDIKEYNPNSKIFVLSNFPVSELRNIFNYAPDIEYFNKKDTSEASIAKYIKNYFNTNGQRIFNNVFIVYGHNKSMRENVESFISSQGINSIDLLDNSSTGLHTIFDSLMESLYSVECAIVLLSADDTVIDNENDKLLYRARQNVIFELGFFAGNLGKNKTIVLYEKHNNFEFPSDISGIYYIEYSDNLKWKNELLSNLKKIGFNV